MNRTAIVDAKANSTTGTLQDCRRQRPLSFTAGVVCVLFGSSFVLRPLTPTSCHAYTTTASVLVVHHSSSWSWCTTNYRRGGVCCGSPNHFPRRTPQQLRLLKDDDDDDDNGPGSTSNNNNNNNNTDKKDDANKNKNIEDSSASLSLARRIQQIQDKYDMEDDAMSEALRRRINEVKDSESMNQRFQFSSSGGDSLAAAAAAVGGSSSSSSATNGDTLLRPHTQVVQLPVLAMDALLPNQRLEGRTEDPTFSCFLRELGLGGYFVMTSVDPSVRKIRRHGVIAKIVAMDALKLNHQHHQQQQQGEQDELTSIPTAVDFEIVGVSPCRIVAPPRINGIQRRLGRWRRCYDPNGEESVLGWGEEPLVDASLQMILDPTHENVIDDTTSTIDSASTTTSRQDIDLPCTVWNKLNVLVNVDTLLFDDNHNKNKNINELKVAELAELVDEWYRLASSTKTYQNTNVTAASRIRPNEPGLWIEPDKLLAKVSRQLGPRPTDEDPNQFCLWSAALINPLPVLGVSLEIRGRILEAPTISRRLEVLELGLRRSIDNLKGIRPLR